MLDNRGFDLWADGDDLAVGLSDEENTYPFAGYKEILGNFLRDLLEAMYDELPAVKKKK